MTPVSTRLAPQLVGQACGSTIFLERPLMPNRLADSTSPYLLQHKDNPVDWWEWSDEAFAEARRRDVPILLSVGYAACHWCHEAEWVPRNGASGTEAPESLDDMHRE
jgi:hypothetical protein